jgi:hypothetical protein
VKRFEVTLTADPTEWAEFSAGTIYSDKPGRIRIKTGKVFADCRLDLPARAGRDYRKRPAPVNGSSSDWPEDRLPIAPTRGR